MEKKEDLISVIFPVYNTEETYLREAIESILNQTYKNFEFIIINDASNEQTVDVLHSYSDKRIKIISNENNKGITKSLNVGLSYAKGKYIMRMDADDIAVPERMELQYKYMEKHKDVAVVGGMAQVMGTDMVYGKNYGEKHEVRKVRMLLYNDGVVHPTAFIRSAFLKKNNIQYNEDIKKSQDYELWSQIILKGKIEILPKIVLKYRVHENQISTYASDEQVKYSNQIRMMQLRRIGEFTPDEEKIFIKLCHREESDDYDKLIKKIQKLNEKSKIYKSKTLKQELYIWWVDINIKLTKRNKYKDISSKYILFCIYLHIKNRIRNLKYIRRQ